MKIKCRCGHENVTLMPFDDHTVTWIECTRACQQARQLKAALATPVSTGRLSDAFPNVHLNLQPTGILGH